MYYIVLLEANWKGDWQGGSGGGQVYMRPIHSTKYLYLVQYIVLHCTTGQTGRETGKEGVDGGRCTCRERGGHYNFFDVARKLGFRVWGLGFRV